PATPFVGREREVARLAQMLRRPEVRLLTLTGPGGSGKTRLAIELARSVAPTFADGVRWVPLETVDSAEQVTESIAAAVDGHGDVRTALADRELLLVVDCFERVIGAAIDIGELLASCQLLKVLVTTRESLKVSAEHQHSVQPLALDDAIALFHGR